MPIKPIRVDSASNILDIAFKTATILIAFFNAFFAVRIFNFKNKKDDIDKEGDRKLQLLKTLVLDHSLSSFYKILEDIETICYSLKTKDISEDNKRVIEDAIGIQFVSLRRKFYDSLLGIDNNLYISIRDKSDLLQSDITNAMFDPGIVLSHEPKFNDLILEKIITTKLEIIKTLFSYRG